MFSLSELSDKKLHFIGIGGAGMSGLARIALTHSAAVSGSDEKDSSVLAALAALGAKVFSSHGASQRFFLLMGHPTLRALTLLFIQMQFLRIILKELTPSD